jgi:hypothetical protein
LPRLLPAVRAGRSEPTRDWMDRLSPPRGAGRARLWAARSGAVGVPISLLISKLFRGRRRSPERKLGCCCFCQRFTRRLDVVLDVNVVVDVSLLVSRKPLEEDSFLWRRPRSLNRHPTGSHLKPGRRRAPHGHCKPAWSGRSAGSGPSGFQGSRLQPTREGIGEAKNE